MCVCVQNFMILFQAHGWCESGEVKSIPFPFDRDSEVPVSKGRYVSVPVTVFDDPVPNKLVFTSYCTDELLQHPCLQVLEKEIDVQHTCGYIIFLRTGAPVQQPDCRGQSSSTTISRKQPTAEEKAKQSEISDFLEDLKELGIGDPKSNNTPGVTDQEAESSAGNQHQNGIKTARKENGTSEAGGDSFYSEESMTPFQKKLLEEWLPLELSFGIPLFSDDANRIVCGKVNSN